MRASYAGSNTLTIQYNNDPPDTYSGSYSTLQLTLVVLLSHGAGPLVGKPDSFLEDQVIGTWNAFESSPSGGGELGPCEVRMLAVKNARAEPPLPSPGASPRQTTVKADLVALPAGWQPASPASWKVTVNDAQTVVRAINGTVAITPGATGKVAEISAQWDGRDNNGQVLPTKEYGLGVQALAPVEGGGNGITRVTSAQGGASKQVEILDLGSHPEQFDPEAQQVTNITARVVARNFQPQGGNYTITIRPKGVAASISARLEAQSANADPPGPAPSPVQTLRGHLTFNGSSEAAVSESWNGKREGSDESFPHGEYHSSRVQSPLGEHRPRLLRRDHALEANWDYT
jgi:hypothetical protein